VAAWLPLRNRSLARHILLATQLGIVGDAAGAAAAGPPLQTSRSAWFTALYALLAVSSVRQAHCHTSATMRGAAESLLNLWFSQMICRSACAAYCVVIQLAPVHRALWRCIRRQRCCLDCWIAVLCNTTFNKRRAEYHRPSGFTDYDVTPKGSFHLLPQLGLPAEWSICHVAISIVKFAAEPVLQSHIQF